MNIFYEGFGFGAQLTLDGRIHEREVSEKCRAKFIRHPSGHIDCLGFEWNAARPGKPDLWMPFEALLKDMRNKLADDEREILEEDERENAQLEEERRWEEAV